MGSVADRHQWAIERGKEYDPTPISVRCWFTSRFVSGLRMKAHGRTGTQSSSIPGCTRTRSPARWLGGWTVAYSGEPGDNMAPPSIKSKNTPQVLLTPLSKNTPEVLSIEPLECSNSTSEMPLKDLKDNIKEQEKDNMHSRIREHLDKCPDAERSNAIRHALDYWPDWRTGQRKR